MVDVDVVVVVPRLAVAVPHLHEPHAALDQPPGDEHLPRLHAVAVQVEDVLRLAADVERVGRFDLHAVGQLERLDLRFELRVARALGGVLGVECLRAGRAAAADRSRATRSLRMFSISSSTVCVLRVDVRALIDAGQEAGLPVLRFLNRIAAGAHGDERRQVLVLAAQAVRDPRPDAGPR